MPESQLPGMLILVEADAQDKVMGMYPFGAYELDSAAPMPDELRADFREAGKCLGAGCFKASLVMSRRALQRCLKEQGCTQRNLVDAIDYALKNGALRGAFQALAQEVRAYGNLGAHPDDDQLGNADLDSARQVLEFTRLLIHEFYEIPAAATLLKQNRAKTTP